MELPACPVETTLMLIGDKWKVLILRDLMDGTKRFGELEKFHRARHAEGTDRAAARHGGKGSSHTQGLRRGPPRVEYTLTPTGYSLRPILDSMVAWGTGYQQQMSGADSAD